MSVKLVATELVSESRPDELDRVSGPEDAGRILQDLIGSSDREKFAVLHLDVQNQIIASEIVSVGSLCASLVHPREVFKGLILNNAAGFIAGHNHPSGVLVASREDMGVKTRLESAGKLLGIQMLDFMIVSPVGYVGGKNVRSRE
jgi:DNA repair protein RadC